MTGRRCAADCTCRRHNHQPESRGDVAEKRWRRASYERNRGKQLRLNAAGRERRKANALAYVNGLKCAPCTDCGQVFIPPVMEFDHVRGEKVQTISRMVKLGVLVDRIKAEVAKCELVCANCHRIRTFERGWSDGS